jgi:hypothetical protein
MNKKLISIGLLQAAGVAVYILAIAFFFSNAEKIFAGVKEPNILIPLGMLLLFVVSALITSGMVLGKPIYLILNGNKKDAILLVGYTLGWLTIITFLVFVSLVLIK